VLSALRSAIYRLRLAEVAGRSAQGWHQLPSQVGPAPTVEGLRALLVSAGRLLAILRGQAFRLFQRAANDVDFQSI